MLVLRRRYAVARWYGRARLCGMQEQHARCEVMCRAGECNYYQRTCAKVLKRKKRLLVQRESWRAAGKGGRLRPCRDCFHSSRSLRRCLVHVARGERARTGCILSKRGCRSSLLPLQIYFAAPPLGLYIPALRSRELGRAGTQQLWAAASNLSMWPKAHHDTCSVCMVR